MFDVIYIRQNKMTLPFIPLGTQYCFNVKTLKRRRIVKHMLKDLLINILCRNRIFTSGTRLLDLSQCQCNAGYRWFYFVCPPLVYLHNLYGNVYEKLHTSNDKAQKNQKFWNRYKLIVRKVRPPACSYFKLPA